MSVGDAGNLMIAKQILPVLSYRGRGVSDIIWKMTQLYAITKVANALEESTESIKSM